MFSVTDLSKRYGDKVLFDEVNLRFDPGKCYGIVGANGAGKSTLLRIITGEETADSGEINIPTRTKLGTLTQDHFGFEDETISDVVMLGKPKLAEAIVEKERLMNDHSAPAEKIAHMEEIIADHDGYVAHSRIGEMLEGLGIPTEKHEQKMASLSGGFKLRVLLAQCLFGDPDVLLLDEPTNHLDIISIRWLENYIREFRGTVIIVSHDREFLNNVCTNILDIDYGTVKEYPGNYDFFVAAKEADDLMRQQEAEKAEKKISELQNFVERFKAKASKARQAQSKAKQIERMESGIEAPVYTSRVYPKIAFTPRRPPGKEVLKVKDLSKSYGDKQVLQNIDFTVFRDDKIAIIGPNGVGKSTLLKAVMDEIGIDSGSVEWGYETYPEYFSQDHHESFPTDTSPYEWLYQFAPGESIGVIRGTLGNMLFSGDDVHKSTAALSGGEAARLVLAKLMLLKGNVMILDEPTNHLDMESIEALVESLQKFEGTILLVSHNRYVVNRVATKVMEITPEGVDLFDGTYAEFLEKVGNDHLAYQVDLRANSKKDKPKDYKKDKYKKKEKAENRKAFQTEAKPLQKRSKNLEEEIEKLEIQVEEINDLFFDPTYFNRASPEEVREKNVTKKNLEDAMEKAMADWETVNQEIEALRTKYNVD